MSRNTLDLTGTVVALVTGAAGGKRLAMAIALAEAARPSCWSTSERMP